MTVTAQAKQEEQTQKNILITHYHYTVQYVGSEYFADTVFTLTEEEKMIAEEYAANLNLILQEEP